MPTTQVLTLDELKKELKPRDADANKSAFGRVLVIGGDVGMSGAVHMSGEAALRAGAGLVKIATHPQHAANLNVTRPELMVRPVFNPDELTPLLDEASHMVLGPGFGQSDWAVELFETAIKSKKPMVVDADGLNLLAKHPKKNKHWILTPHPGEAGRLLGQTAEKIQANRIEAIKALHAKYAGTIVLKGHHTLITDDGKTIYQCDQGNPGMATAGMGDILSGVIGGLMPQCDSLLHAACLGVCVHAVAGDKAASAGERGLIATDLLPFIQELLD